MKIASVQLKSELGNKEKNFTKIKSFVTKIKKESPDTDLILFPECAINGYECPETFEDTAETIDGGIYIEKMKLLAKENKVHIAFGFVERSDKLKNNKFFNSAVLIDDEGKVVGVHRKTHLVRGFEMYAFNMGKEFEVFNTKLGKIAMMICWESAFPEVARQFAVRGADVILVLEAVEKGIENEWELILRARAMDNTIHLISANHVGKDRTLDFSGNSIFVSSLGEKVEALSDKEGILYGEIDFAKQKKDREYFYMLNDRRPEIYKL